MRAQTIGLVAHTGKAGVSDLARELVREFQRHGITVLMERATAGLAKMSESVDVAELNHAADLIVVLGGDGTILNVVAETGGNTKPIFGINVGSLGFLTCVNSSAYREAVAAIVRGDIVYSARALLEVELRDECRTILSLRALNDAVVSRGDLSRLIRLRARVDGETLTEFNADGLIVATPTGSTAYSLSAGGPILAPHSGVFVITPICPHVLTNRSVIVSESSVIEVSPARNEYPTFLSVDGREPVRVPSHGEVVVRRAETTLQLGFLPEVTFFAVLRQKLKWTGSNI
ncbi:MAG: NAD(+)/NADH kinase [Verrucomicrobia bacterium]|nr:NAD(+)/NADH kinase [Verrucomicrobiota bacterium]